MNPETNERIETVDVESNPSMDASAALSSAKSLNQIPSRQAYPAACHRAKNFFA